MDEPVEYMWQETVVRAFGGEKPFRVGLQDGMVVLEPPPFGTCTADPDAADRLSAAIKACANRARLQRQAGPGGQR